MYAYTAYSLRALNYIVSLAFRVYALYISLPHLETCPTCIIQVQQNFPTIIPSSKAVSHFPLQKPPRHASPSRACVLANRKQIPLHTNTHPPSQFACLRVIKMPLVISYCEYVPSFMPRLNPPPPPHPLPSPPF